MIGVAFQLPIWFDLGAVFLLALTGVWAAGRRGYDIIGAFIMAFVTGLGGGLLRDAVFLQEIPLVMQDVRYLWAVFAAVLAGGITYRLADRFEQGISYVDAAATGAYGVYGANKALLAGLPPEAALLVGVCNAVGGGLIRETFCGAPGSRTRAIMAHDPDGLRLELVQGPGDPNAIPGSTRYMAGR